MIKVFSNKTNSPKIKVESKFVVSKTTVKKDDLLTGLTKNDLLFVKLTFSGLESPQIINSVKLRMMCSNAYANIGVKVIKCNDTSISDSNIKTLANSITGNEEALEKTIIYGSGHSLNKPGNQTYMLDITNVIKKVSSINPTIMMAISFPFGTTGDFGVYSPQKLAEGNEICISTMSEIVGLNNMYKYDEHDFGRCGKVSVNLATGKPIYTLNLLSSVGKKMPISFSVCQNTDKGTTPYFGNKVIPNFQYGIYKHDDCYVIEDATGFKNYYSKIEYKAENKADLTDNYGIKHLENSGDIYLSYLDNSYIFVVESENLTSVKLYDKGDTRIDFEIVSGICRILMVETALGYKLTYTWSNSKLEKISNTDGEETLVCYSSGGHIQKVSFPDNERAIEFTENTVNQTLNIRTYYYKKKGSGSATQTTTETICETKLYFSSNWLIKVEDVATGQNLKVLHDTIGRVLSVGIYSASGSEKEYLTTYQYNTKFTKVSNLEGDAIHYSFDNYGRVKTIMDDKAKTVTYNYDEFENGESLRLIGQSKTQNNARNLLENHSFEDENIFSSKLMSWKILGSTGSKGEIIRDGVFGEKCLKLCAVSSDKASIYQNVVNPQAGTYVLKGFIKHPNISSFSKDDVTVGISGTYTVEEEVIVRVNSNTTRTEMRPVTRSFTSLAVLDFSKSSWYSFVTPKVTIPTSASDITMTVELNVNHKSTTIYLDDLQLTDSEYFTRFNLIENGYMEFESNSRPYGWTFDNFETEDKIVKITSDPTHPSLLGDNVMRIAPGNINKTDYSYNYKVKKMYKEISLKGLAGEQLIFSVFGKGCVTENVIFRAFIKFVYENKGEVYSQFDFEKHFDNWQMLTRAITAEDNFSKVIVGVEYDGGAEVMLDCFQLYKDSFGKYYNYDAKGNITEVIDGNGTSSRVTYDSNNKVDEIYSSDGSYFKYKYDTKGRLYNVTDLNKNRIDITYDDDDRVIKTTITANDGEKIENTTAYNDVINKETSTDEFGNIFSTSMDYLNRVTSQIDANGLETEFAYNHKSELEEMYAIVESVTNKNSFAYDAQGNTKTIQSSNGTLYDLTYDTFGRLLSVKCNGSYLEKYQYDSLVNGYRKGQLVKKMIGSNGDYYEFKYDDLGQVSEVKLNGASIVTYSYDENGNVYELYDVKSKISSYFTYDLQGNLLKKKTSDNNDIFYTYDNLGNVQKVTYNINNSIRSIDYEYDYEFNEYTKEGYFNRLSNMYGDELVISGHGTKGQFGAKPLFNTCSFKEDMDMNMYVLEFADKYDFVNYETKTFNKNRTSGVVNGKVYSYDSWNSRFANNKTFYAFIKPTGSYAKENLFTFGFCDDFESGSSNIQLYSNLCINAGGKIAYYSEGGNETIVSSSQVKLNEWNLVGIKMFKENGKNKILLILNEQVSTSFEINEKINSINYLLVGYQNKLMPAVAATSSSKNTTTSNLAMPFKLCMMSFGAYDYKAEDFNAIYKEGIKYLFKQPLVKSNGTIYYDEKTYKDFDVVTLNGSLESSKGLKPIKLATIDKSYRFDKTRIFKYDEESNKHVFGSYKGIVNLNPGNNSTLAYQLPLTTSGTISLRFKTEPISEIRYLMSIKGTSEIIGLYLDTSNKLLLSINGTNLTSTSTKVINDNKWHQVVLRYQNSKLQVYLDNMASPLYVGTNTINLSNTAIYLGNDSTGTKALNGCLEMFAWSNQFVTDAVVTNLFTKGSTIIVRNKQDTLGRVTQNQILIEGKELLTKFDYNKTRVSKQTLHNQDSITYSYDNMNNVTSKITLENGGESQVQYTYDQLGRLKSEIKENGEVERFTYYPNGNIDYREVVRNNVTVIKEEYQYDTVIKDRLLRIKDLISNNIVQDITYDSGFVFNPKQMMINGVSKTLTWQGRRLTGITGSTYEYNGEGARTKKVTPNETTTFELEGSHIISMNKVTSAESVRLDFVYDASATLIGVNTQEGHYFYVRDITGNVLGLIDQTGDFIVKYRYDAWGKLLEKKICKSCIASRHNPFVYKGYFLDEETGFYYLKSRYYDPNIRRFISIDSPQYIDEEDLSGLNLYAYCGNNPLMNVDPSGNSWTSFWKSTFGKVLGTVLVVAAVVVLSVATAGVGAAVTTALGSGFMAAVAGGAVGGAISGTIFGAGISMVSQGISNGYANIDYAKVGVDALIGGVSGAVLGGLSGGFKYVRAARYLKSNGCNKEQISQVMKSFKGTPRLKNVSTGTTANRYWGGTAKEIGHWLTSKTYSNPIQALALNPSWGNTATNVSTIVFNQNTTILVGKAAAQGFLSGSGIQWYVANLAWLGLI